MDIGFIEQVPCKFCGQGISKSNIELHEARCQKIQKPISQLQSQQKSKVSQLMQQSQQKNQQQQLQSQVQSKINMNSNITQSLLADLKCSLCNQQFTNCNDAEVHIQECLEINSPIPCDVCFQNYPLFLIQYHREICNGQPDNSSVIRMPSNINNNKNNNYNNDNNYNNNNNSNIRDLMLSRYQKENGSELNYNQRLQLQQQQQREQQGEFEDDNLYFDENNQEQDEDYQSYVEDDDRGEEEDEDQDREEDGGQEGIFDSQHINNILDRGGQLPQFEDIDQSNTGGMSQDQIDNFPVIKYNDNCKKLSDSSLNSCSICIDNYKRNDDIKTIACLHRFHNNCINKWLQKSRFCPICKLDQSKQFE